jgi:aspartokinase
VTTPGVYGKILRTLEWNGINVVEVASTYTEFTIILKDGDIDRAFATIKRALS